MGYPPGASGGNSLPVSLATSPVETGGLATTGGEAYRQFAIWKRARAGSMNSTRRGALPNRPLHCRSPERAHRDQASRGNERAVPLATLVGQSDRRTVGGWPGGAHRLSSRGRTVQPPHHHQIPSWRSRMR